MKLSALFITILIVNGSVHSQLPVVASSGIDIQSVQSHRTLDIPLNLHADIVNRTQKNLRKNASSSIDSQIKWQQVYGPFGSTVRSFLRAPNGVMFLCSEGGIYRSKSIGDVWEKLRLPNSSDYGIISTMSIHPNGTILAFAYNHVFRSADNGDTWTVTDIVSNILHVAVDSIGNLYGANYDAGVLYSDDIGRSWKSFGLASKNLLSLIITKTGKFICGGTDAMYTSVNNGVSWERVDVGDGQFLRLKQDSIGRIFALGENHIFMSLDDGVTWRTIVQSYTGMYRFYVDEELSLYYTDLNGIHISKNGGDLWEKLPFISMDILCMHIVNKDTLMAGTFFGVNLSVDGGRTWRNNDSGLVSLNIRSITETKTGDLVVSAGRQIYKSTDQGNHWQLKFYSRDLLQVLAKDGDGRLYASDLSFLRRSSDNGENWDEIFLYSGSYHFTAAAITADKRIFGGTGNGEILRRRDGGPVEKIFADSRGQAINEIVIDKDGGVYCSTLSAVYKSVDSGLTWKEALRSSGTSSISTIFCTDTFLYAATYYDGLFRSADRGRTWEKNTTVSTTDPILGMVKNSYGVLYAVGAYDVYESTDSGTTWNSAGSGLPAGMKKSLCLTRGGDLFIGTHDKGVYTSRSIVANVEPSAVEKNYSLAQNFPNPFNPSTTISFIIPKRSFVTLKVFDALGREIATIVSEDLPAGNYQRRWNAANLSSGVYFYRLQAGRFKETKHLLLIK